MSSTTQRTTLADHDLTYNDFERLLIAADDGAGNLRETAIVDELKEAFQEDGLDTPVSYREVETLFNIVTRECHGLR